MRIKYKLHPVILIISLFFWGCNTQPDSARDVRNREPLVVFLVRHAEKVDQSKDPDLNPAGYLRAEELARVLADAGIQRVHSTDFIRTRETARPVAGLFGLEIEIYGKQALYIFSDELIKAGGRHLVVGHSNTTPMMVELLGGDPGPAINEFEYDRLYILTFDRGKVSTVMLRYGESSSSLPSKISASSLLVPQTSGSALN